MADQPQISDNGFLSKLYQVAELEGGDPEELAERLDRVWGHLPISDRMAPRYRRAVGAFLSCSSPTEVLAIDAEIRGDLKGIFSRVARRDQWDWMDVQIGLQIRRANSRQVASLLNQFSKADETQRVGLYEELMRLNVPSHLEALGAYLDAQFRGLPKVTRSERQHTGEQASASKRSIDFAPIAEKILAAGKVHANTEKTLVRFLTSHGFRCEQNVFLDVFTRLKTGAAMFEVKSINENNEKSQTRKAVGQLLEYRFLHAEEGATLWILFSKEPWDKRTCVEFPRSIGIRVIWIGSEALDGPDVGSLLLSQ